jgi:hypothetical protein
MAIVMKEANNKKLEAKNYKLLEVLADGLKLEDVKEGKETVLKLSSFNEFLNEVISITVTTKQESQEELSEESEDASDEE